MRQPADVLKHLAEEAARIGRFDCAAYYARQALAAGVTLAGLASLRYSPPRMAKSSRMITPLEQRLIRYQPGQFSDRRRNILMNAPELGGAAVDRVGDTADPGQITQHYHRRPQIRIAAGIL